ncbi:MAG: hypothetical protein WAV11_00715 [Minisyncoccia bacterium]
MKNEMKDEKMPQGKIDGFFEEFPILSTLINRRCVSKITVQRIDLEFCKRKILYGFDASFSSDWERMDEKIYTFDYKWKKLGQVGQKTLTRDFSWWQKIFVSNDLLYCNGDSCLEDHLTSLNNYGINPERVSYVISIKQWDGGEVTIYKTPKGKTITAYIQEEKARIKAEIQSEIAKTD